MPSFGRSVSQGRLAGSVRLDTGILSRELLPLSAVDRQEILEDIFSLCGDFCVCVCRKLVWVRIQCRLPQSSVQTAWHGDREDFEAYF